MSAPSDPRIKESLDIAERARVEAERIEESGDGLLSLLAHRLHNMTSIYESERQRSWAAHKSVASGAAEKALSRLYEKAQEATPEHLFDATREDLDIVYEALVGLKRMDVAA